MLQSKADKLLNRITALHRSLQLNDEDDAPSALERDLMLGYLRDLYAVYLDLGQPQSTGPKEMPPKPETPATPTPEPKPQPAPPPPVRTPEPEIPAPRPETPAPAVPPEVPDVPMPPPPAPPVATHTARIDPEFQRPSPEPAVAERKASPDVEALFREDEENGLTNRLMRQRVTDLTRSLSINNRVLFSNKLFDGNEDLNAALKDLNLRGSFANAKPLLADLARQHQWTHEDRQETAREFIDLVRRRYA
ncbi:hypothetical protein GGR26_002948 [Lewinella marina]|uniref:Uncharacterized protein n=1 Tax=Neolewinella marina TaxID=438751 RepID=A0A2G0CBF7_9BACT|nr:hypothetical protein [Neolewinella marina]NJB87171.1 hypothetical protein [Neolewinella marina]PHK97304.1 hypothetical protein CGL56_15975 [Neolewinella marina]